ncbi:MAG: M61 family metallopeptidase [Chthonomonas sp.]|nr:M61 family metallopeptidase [Chthonomonas sp.]
MKRTCTLGFVLATAFAQAKIHYTVDVRPDSNTLHVTMRIPNTTGGAKLLIPNWAPGAYILRDNFKSVQNLKATDQSGKDLAIKQDITIARRFFTLPTRQDVALNEVSTWSVAPASETVVEYDIPVRFSGEVVHWSGPSTYMYEMNRKDEETELAVRAPSGWNIFTGLDEKAEGVFDSPDYDTLADNPVTVGKDVLVDHYTSHGKPHTIVMRGAPKSQVKRDYLIKACKHVSDAQGHFFGNELPFSKYVWHFDVNGAPDGAGGLEHLSSTQITLAAGVGPRAVSVLSHEFFHLWNVKRIRSSVLGPFDYTKLPTTGALWWLEGVTDYYASYLLYRYGWSTEGELFAEVNSTYQGVSRSQPFSTVSPHESSWRMPETSNGRGNSNGYLISYYTLGWLAGMCLDLNIRSASGGKHSLDDVTRALWVQNRDGQPGFREDEIRNQVIKFGGPTMGPIYDRIIHQPSMPVAESLALGGFEIGTIQVPFVDHGFSWSQPGQGVTALVVTEVRKGAEGKLMARDTLVSINGKEIKGEGRRGLADALTTAIATTKVGEPMKVVVERAGAQLTFDLIPTQGMRDSVAVKRSPNATPNAKRIGDGWLGQIKL